MPLFTYTVLNKENQELNGSINAENEQAVRQELNGLGFSIVAINLATAAPAEAAEEEATVKFEFAATDKNGKKIVGTIQGENIYAVYKRLIQEYQFDVSALFPADLDDNAKEKARNKGIDDLRDRLLEDNMLEQAKLQKEQTDLVEFAEKQARLKIQVDFVLQKISDMLSTYKEEMDPITKGKIKYYVEKILRIKNSTNLDYIRQTCEELLTYLQKEELFLNKEQRRKEKTQLGIEAKTMMLQLSKVNSLKNQDLFDILRSWRQEHITDNKVPTTIEKAINVLITPFIGPQEEDPEVLAARQKVRDTTERLKEFATLYFQSPDQEYKKEIILTLKRYWAQRQTQVKELHSLIQRKHEESLQGIEITHLENLEHELFGVAGWILTFYIIYYFLAIYAHTKQINLPIPSQLTQLFQTSIIKYFYIILFLFVCFLGLKIEFFKRKKYANWGLTIAFILISTLIIINF